MKKYLLSAFLLAAMSTVYASEETQKELAPLGSAVAALRIQVEEVINLPSEPIALRSAILKHMGLGASSNGVFKSSKGKEAFMIFLDKFLPEGVSNLSYPEKTLLDGKVALEKMLQAKRLDKMSDEQQQALFLRLLGTHTQMLGKYLPQKDEEADKKKADVKNGEYALNGSASSSSSTGLVPNVVAKK